MSASTLTGYASIPETPALIILEKIKPLPYIIFNFLDILGERL